MKKLFAIIAAVLITCGITVAPAFADEVNLEGGDVIDGVVYVHAPISTDTPATSDDLGVVPDDTYTDDTSSTSKAIDTLLTNLSVATLTVLINLLLLALATPWICKEETREDEEC